MRCEVTKKFDFHAAHIIPNHKGKCSTLHGHTYFVEVTVRGEVQLKDSGASDYGMVVDFDVLKKIYKEHIDPLVEHQNLNETLPIPVTTAEMIAGWIWNTFHKAGVTPYKLRVYETPTSYAEIRSGDLL
jgi:6-pyruvoyltetrahydropterin/6-carboxytetrahydropterin synthase